MRNAYFNPFAIVMMAEHQLSKDGFIIEFVQTATPSKNPISSNNPYVRDYSDYYTCCFQANVNGNIFYIEFRNKLNISTKDFTLPSSFEIRSASNYDVPVLKFHYADENVCFEALKTSATVDEQKLAVSYCSTLVATSIKNELTK